MLIYEIHREECGRAYIVDKYKGLLHLDALVLTCFRGQSPQDGKAYFPYHKDGNMRNSAISNLEWREETPETIAAYQKLEKEAWYKNRKIKATKKGVIKQGNSDLGFIHYLHDSDLDWTFHKAEPWVVYEEKNRWGKYEKHRIAVDKMYRWIIDNQGDIGIKPSDVIIISSDPSHQEFTREYRENPEVLMSKGVVLITHRRFWTDLINYFLIYKPISQDCGFKGDFRSLMARDDLRRYVIFDETPVFIKPFFTMPRALLGAFADHSGGGWHCKDRGEIEYYYKKFIQGTELDPFPNPDYKINRIKRDVVLDLLPQHFGRWIENEEAAINFTPLSLCQPVIKSHILIMEGAGNM